MEIENSIAVVAATEIPRLSPVDLGRPAAAGRPRGRRGDGRRRLYLDYGRLMADKCRSLPVVERTPCGAVELRSVSGRSAAWNDSRLIHRPASCYSDYTPRCMNTQKNNSER